MTFDTSELLQEAKRKVRHAEITLDICTKPVWLDIEKTRTELRPARIIHRATEMLEEIESLKVEKITIEKFINGKQIKSQGKMLAWSFHGALQYSAYARQRYSEEERQQVVAFAES